MSAALPDIIRDFKRLPAAIVAQAAELQPAILADVAGRRGAMHGRIKALRPRMKLAGTAFTVEVRPGDNLSFAYTLQPQYPLKAKTPVTMFLVKGVKLQGVVTWFDNFCVLLRRDGHSQLVYKHAISTIMPGHPVQLFEGAEEAPSGE